MLEAKVPRSTSLSVRPLASVEAWICREVQTRDGDGVGLGSLLRPRRHLDGDTLLPTARSITSPSAVGSTPPSLMTWLAPESFTVGVTVVSVTL